MAWPDTLASAGLAPPGRAVAGLRPGKYFCAPARGATRRKCGLYSFRKGPAILDRWPDFAKGRPPTASKQLEALLGQPWRFPGRPPKHDLSTSTVTDEWPEHVPVKEAEVDVLEAWFGDFFDELFGPCR